MKLPFNLGFGKAGRRQKGGDKPQASVDEAAADSLEARRRPPVILDDPDADEGGAEPPFDLEKALTAAPASAEADGPGRVDPAQEADRILAILAEEEAATGEEAVEDEDRPPKRRRARRALSLAAGVTGLVAIGGVGWWLASLQGGIGYSDVPRVAVAIPPPSPPSGASSDRPAADDTAGPSSVAEPAREEALAPPQAPVAAAPEPQPVPGTAAAPPAGGEAGSAPQAAPAAVNHPSHPPASAAPAAVAPPAGLRTLNTLSANEEGPGAGIVVASISPQAFADLPVPPAAGPLPPVPDPALVENGPFGRLPKVDSEGRRPWQIYARPFEPREEQAKWPRVAVMISGLGLSRAATEAAIRHMPGPVSLAFNPYGERLDTWVPLAREAGHEFYIGLPLEPETFPAEDPGPLGLLITLEPVEKRQRLDKVLGRMAGYTGIVGQMGGRYLTDEAQVTPMLTSMRLRGLMFVDASMHPKSLVPTVGSKIGLAHATVGVSLDGDASARSTDSQLARAEALAREHGQVIVLGRPSPLTLERLSAWIAGLAERRLLLAPVSALAKGQKDK